MKKLFAAFVMCTASAALGNYIDEFACEEVSGQLLAPTVLKRKGDGYLVACHPSPASFGGGSVT